MQKLINNPLFRIVGIALILYYGLFHDKKNPDSLGNRLSPDKIKSNLKEISNKSVDMMGNIQKAEELKKVEENQQNIQNTNQNEQQIQQ